MSIVDDMLRGLAVLFVVGLTAMGGAYAASVVFDGSRPAHAQGPAVREARNQAGPAARTPAAPRQGAGRDSKAGPRTPRKR